MAYRRLTYKTPPRKLTPKVHKDILAAIDAGLRFATDWCGYAGISTTSLDNWRELAATDEPGADLARKLFDDIEETIAKRKARYLLKMQLVGQDDWRMWREMVALVDPKGYGPKAELEITGNQTMNVVLTWGDSDADANHAAETP